jgi:ABC-type lipopolysaccharide export system ATPase subunit
MASILEVDSIIKSYGNWQVLTDIYLKCCTGDIIGMLGRNGSGKSTLLGIIFGTVPAERRFTRIDGKPFGKALHVKDAIRFLPQFHFLPGRLTVEQAAAICLGSRDQAIFCDDPILEDLRKYRISSLSGGERRYLEVRLVLGGPSKFVLLDEPFNGSSPLLIDRLRELILAASATKGIIMTDHDYRNVLSVANRWCLLHDGGIRKIKNREQLVQWGYLPTPAR